MDTGLILSIIALVVLITLSAYFSATETAFTSLNKIRIKNLAQSGNKKARSVYNLLQNSDRLLSTILIGNNLVLIIATSIATLLFTNQYGPSGVSISTAVMTVVVLIFGEISPKILAKDSPESFAMFSSSILKLFLFVLQPVNFLVMLWRKLLSKIFKTKDDQGITEEELITLIDEAENEGGINSQEGELIRSAIEFNDTDVEEILTPRVDVIAIEEDTPMQEIAQIFRLHGYSRLPVYRGSIDTIIGVLHEKDFYTLLYREAKTIKNAITNVITATENMKISALLRLLQQDKSHIAIVVDEFGGTQGIVTLEDILEELVGEIWDEHDEVVELYNKVSDTVYLVSGNANFEDMLEALDIKQLKKEYDSQSVSGWVIEEFGRLPEQGDGFMYGPHAVTITKTDFRRVTEIKIEKGAEPEDPEDVWE